MSRRLAQPEFELQAAVVAQLRARGVPRLVFWHTPNSSKLGGKRTKEGIPLEAIRLKKIGLRAGVSDLVFLHPTGVYVLELKHGSTPTTPDQDEFLADAAAAGAHTAVARSLNEAIRQLEIWGLLRGKSQ